MERRRESGAEPVEPVAATQQGANVDEHADRDAGPAPDRDPDEDGEPKGASKRTRVFFGSIVALLAIAVLVSQMVGGDSGGGNGQEDTEEAEDALVTSVFGTIEQFDRPDSDSLGAFTADREWDPVTGVWGIEDGDARVIESDEFRNHAVVRLGQGDGAVQVRLDRVTPGAGLVFRFQGPANYWSVTAAPSVGTWNLNRVTDTASELVDNTGPSPVTAGTTVAARFEGDQIEVIINGKARLIAEDNFLADAGQVGITVRGEDAIEARFDDFVAALPGDRALFISSGDGTTADDG